MGTDLRDVPNIARSISMKRNWGGDLYGGVTVVVTTSNPEYDFARPEKSVVGMFHQIRVNRDEARYLAQELMLFAEGNEVTALSEMEDPDYPIDWQQEETNQLALKCEATLEDEE